MGKKSAHTGESPKDRSINIMDKFIARSNRQSAHKPILPARRKDPNIPIYMWPLKDQLEYWESRTDTDRFDETYPAYSYWIAEVQANSGVHSEFFTDCAIKLKSELLEMYEQKLTIKDAVRSLRKHGVY
jgi:hypothetical protein